MSVDPIYLHKFVIDRILILPEGRERRKVN